ncbi:unnamed protein product [Danaus chrysippus]|uniref:(African queen) hypothetical protein n=1 Tax=Danaus chrysippus TaxID=151541 RepID=A0A8J2QJ22_9NEOP|nr:unnamed protein product [Danaus chrysippus]
MIFIVNRDDYLVDIVEGNLVDNVVDNLADIVVGSVVDSVVGSGVDNVVDIEVVQDVDMGQVGYTVVASNTVDEAALGAYFCSSSVVDNIRFHNTDHMEVSAGVTSLKIEKYRFI